MIVLASYEQDLKKKGTNFEDPACHTDIVMGVLSIPLKTNSGARNIIFSSTGMKLASKSLSVTLLRIKSFKATMDAVGTGVLEEMTLCK
jgi:hypothetical protein